MCLSGEEDLNRSPGIVEDSGESFGVVKDERGAFISCEASCEADGQRVLVEVAGSAGDVARGSVAGLKLEREAAANFVNERAAEVVAKRPEFGGGDAVGARPPGLIGGEAIPVGLDVARVELGGGGVEPGLGVDAIGDVVDGNVVRGGSVIRVLPHFA